MDENEQIRESLEAQSQLHQHIQSLLQRIRELAAAIEQVYEQKPMCKVSSCCSRAKDVG